METVKFVYNDTQVDFLPVGNDSLMINATQMAKVFNKDIRDFMILKQTKDFINACLKTGNSRFLEIKNEEDLYIFR